MIKSVNPFLPTNNFFYSETDPKIEYIEKLISPDADISYETYRNELKNLQLSIIKNLYIALSNVFKLGFSCSNRIKIIRSLLEWPETEWVNLLKQVDIIFPQGTHRAEDVLRAMEILKRSCKNTNSYTELGNTVTLLFSSRTTSRAHRYNLLKTLATYDSLSLKVIDQYTDGERFRFISHFYQKTQRENISRR
jgi:hypothetical protein